MEIEVVQVYVSLEGTFLSEEDCQNCSGFSYEQVLALKIGNDYFKLEQFKHLVR